MKKSNTGERIENNLSNKIHIAIFENSRFRNICIDNYASFSLSRWRIENCYPLCDNLKSYRNGILAVGGNNLSTRTEPNEDPSQIQQKISELNDGIQNLRHSASLVICTVLDRFSCGHLNMESFNKSLSNSNLPFFQLYHKVFKQMDFMPGGVLPKKTWQRECYKVVKENQFHLNMNLLILTLNTSLIDFYVFMLLWWNVS